MDAILIRIDPLDLSTGARVPIYIGDAPGAEYYGLGGITWQPALIERPMLKVNLFDPAMTGKVQAGTANFTIGLAEIEGVANLDNLIWQSAPVLIYNVTQASWANRIVEFNGLVSGPTSNLDLHTLAIEAKVSTTLLDRPILTAKFGGGGGLDGDAALRGTYRPAGFGTVRGAPVVWFDLTRNIGQIDGYGNCLSMSRLLEGANSFGPAVADYGSYAALASAIDGGAVPPGRWASCVAQGLVGLGAPPVSKIQVDAVFGVNRPGSLAYSLLRYRAGIDPSLLDVSAFAALDVAVPFPVHYHTTEQRTCLDFVQALCGECNASPLVTLQGLISVTRAVSSVSPALTLDRSGRIEPRVLDWAMASSVVPYYVLNARTARPGSTISLDEVVSRYDFADQGLYANDRTYREGQVVWLANGSQWLYIATTPGSGHAPPYPATSDAYWQQLQPATTAADITYLDNTPLENLKPAELGANVTEIRVAAAIDNQGVLATLNSANLGSTVKQSDGTTVVTDATAITSQGTALAIDNQGALATLNQTNTNNIVANAVSLAPAIDFTGATASAAISTYLTVASVTITTAATDQVVLLISTVMQVDVTASGGTITNVQGFARVLKNGSEIRAGLQFASNSGSGTSGAASGEISIVKGDAPGAGTFTYSLQVRALQTGGTGTVNETYQAIDGTMLPVQLKR